MLIDEGTGIIVTPPFGNLTSNTLNLSFAEYDAKLLFYLTYFDRIAVTSFNPVVMPGQILQCSTLLEQHLVTSGAALNLFPQRLRQRGPFNASQVREIVEWAARLLNEEQEKIGRQWAITPPDGAVSELEAGDIDTLVMSLQGILPAPLPNTPLDDLLKFKEDHRAQLSRLRHGISKIASSLNAVSANETAKLIEDELTHSIEDVRSTFKSTGMPFFTWDLAIAYRLPAVATAWIGEFIGQNLGLPSGWGAAAGSCIGLNIGKTKISQDSNSYPRDFSYVLSGFRESILKSNPSFELVEYDIENVILTDNDFPMGYPPDLQPPATAKGGSFRGNILM